MWSYITNIIKYVFREKILRFSKSLYPKIKDKFEEFNLLDRVRESPFKQFFERAPIQFSGAFFHQLMLHKIKSDKPDEVHFYVGRKRCRFGRVEFGLVTGLNLLPGPTEEDIKQNGSSDRLIQEYFNGSASITFGQLRRVFESCTEADDVYKLGMALFVMGVLTGKEEKTDVSPFVIRMVDNLPFFYEYPWGKISYTKLMETCNKDYVNVKNKMLKKIEKGVTQKEAKYSAYGYAAALQYWAYEAILQLGNEYAVRRSHRFPRMVNWESKPNTTLGKDEVTRLFAKNVSLLCFMLNSC